jgi:hypothetical protein
LRQQVIQKTPHSGQRLKKRIQHAFVVRDVDRILQQRKSQSIVAACKIQDRGRTGKIKDDAREKASFDETQKETCGEETAVGTDLGLKSRNKTPRDAYCWKKDSRTDSMQDQIRRQLGQDVRNVCHCERCLILMVAQPEVTLQACYSSIADVGSGPVSITAKRAVSYTIITYLSRKANKYSRLGT